jgi:hypothetical protein
MDPSFCQGCIEVTSQLKEKHILYMMGQHCMAYRINLARQTLSNLPMVATLEDLPQFLLFYFSSSPK